MKKDLRSSPVPILILILLLLSPLHAMESFDIGIIKGKKWFMGKHTALLSLFTIKDGKVISIPYQVDRKNDDGTYSMERVLTITGNDEIVFQAEDSGEEGDELILSRFKDKCVKKIKVESGGETGYIYFVYPLKNSNHQRYVTYMKKGDLELIRSDYYEVSYKNQSIFFNTYRTFKTAGGNGKNIIDTLKLRFIIRTLFGIRFERTEKDLTYRVLGVKVGPIRIIRKTSSRLKVFMGLKSPAILVDNYYTKYYLETPSYLTVPFNLSYVASDAYYRQTISYTRAILGDKLYCKGCSKPLIFDGRMSEYEKNISVEPLIWSALIGPTGNIVYLARWSPDIPVTKGLYFMDDSSASDSGENQPGVYEFGYLIGRVLSLKPKKYEFSLSIFAIPGWTKTLLNDTLTANNTNPSISISTLQGCR